MVVCPSLSPFTMMKITAYGGRHLSHIQPFLSLSRVLFRARTFLLFNSLSLSNGKTTCRTASNLQAEILFPSGSMARKCREWLSPSGRVARKRRERSQFFWIGEESVPTRRNMEQYGKAFPLGKREPAKWKCSNSAEKLSPSGRVARKRRERSPFFYKSTMKVSPFGGIWNSMEKPFHSAENIISKKKLNWGKVAAQPTNEGLP